MWKYILNVICWQSESSLWAYTDIIGRAGAGQELNAAEMTTEMMCDDWADINSANLLMRWTLIWMSAVASVKAKGVCPRAFIDRISEVICQHDSNSFGNLPRSPIDWLIIDPCSNRLSVGHSCLWMPNESFCLVLSQQPNPINEWEWVSSSADVNLSLCHLSHIVYWWGPQNGRGHSLRLLFVEKNPEVLLKNTTTTRQSNSCCW